MQSVLELESRPAEPDAQRGFSFGRMLAGSGLVLHGLAHALPVLLVTSAGAMTLRGAPGLLVGWGGAVLGALAMAGFVAAGFGVWRVRPFARHVVAFATMAVAASLLLLALRPEGIGLAVWVTATGALLDAAIGVAILLVRRRVARAGPEQLELPVQRRPLRSMLRGIATVLAVGAVAWIAVALLVRPWTVRWGATRAEIEMPLPGDASERDRLAEIMHATFIAAPPAEVWPWLAQIGQDRAGFYSWDWLERFFGDDVRNADRVHPEWQDLATGGFVRAAQRGYLGGLFGDSIGWKVTELVPGRHLVLERWGTFALRPDGTGTRMIIRTRTGRPAIWAAPILVLGFEPAHFLMERAMLHGIRERAERTLESRSIAPRI